MLAVTPLMGATSLYRAGVGYANAWYKQAPGLVGLWFDAVEPGGDQVDSATKLRDEAAADEQGLDQERDQRADARHRQTSKRFGRRRGPRPSKARAAASGRPGLLPAAVLRAPAGPGSAGSAAWSSSRVARTGRRPSAACPPARFADFGGRGQPRPSHRREGGREPGVAHPHEDLGRQQLDRRRLDRGCRVSSPVLRTAAAALTPVATAPSIVVMP